jgi:hypothetical protein
MVTKYKAHRLKCDWCGRLFWSDERFVVTGNKIVLEYKCNEQFVKNDYRLRREETQEDTE